MTITIVHQTVKCILNAEQTRHHCLITASLELMESWQESVSCRQAQRAQPSSPRSQAAHRWAPEEQMVDKWCPSLLIQYIKWVSSIEEGILGFFNRLFCVKRWLHSIGALWVECHFIMNALCCKWVKNALKEWMLMVTVWPMKKNIKVFLQKHIYWNISKKKYQKVIGEVKVS